MIIVKCFHAKQLRCRGNLSPRALAKNDRKEVFRLVPYPLGELSESVPPSEAVLSESKVKSLLHTLISLLYRKGKDKTIPAILPVAIDFPLVVSGDFLGDG